MDDKQKRAQIEKEQMDLVKAFAVVWDAIEELRRIIYCGGSKDIQMIISQLYGVTADIQDSIRVMQVKLDY